MKQFQNSNTTVAIMWSKLDYCDYFEANSTQHCCVCIYICIYILSYVLIYSHQSTDCFVLLYKFNKYFPIIFTFPLNQYKNSILPQSVYKIKIERLHSCKYVVDHKTEANRYIKEWYTRVLLDTHKKKRRNITLGIFHKSS